jgi:hypothetical protein
MVAMFMREHDGLCRAERALDFLRFRREVRLFHATAEEPVHRKIHARIDHHRPVRVHDLIGGARLYAGRRRLALDGEVLGAAALGELHHVDAQRERARHRPCRLPDRVQVGGPGPRVRLGGHRNYGSKHKQRNGE